MKINKLLIVGFFFGLLLIPLYLASDLLNFSTIIKNALLFGGIVTISVCYVNIVYTQMMRDKDFKTEVLDERNVMIKEKTGYVMSYINNSLLLVAVFLLMILDYKVPAAIVGSIFVLQPIILIAVSGRIEKNY
ncbi:hypothetical protein [Dethiobacter alkaliphilus]|uniref:hypothetical protein n=1 Tax=Dethiobacter alkaliphilus TaxID=427926 RepID=UPI0022260B2A|nr:hypothetical protein [Dethiobacter alkaliphilus]MCW3490376.1 hypothetical protein [Dethiobacter alkaliphilus]